jgi:hypothetical protein
MSVDRAQAEISSAEFAHWIAYANEEPFGYPMDNYRMGIPAAAIVNSIRATIPIPKGKPRPKQVKASDFYPQQEKTAPDLTPEQRAHIRKKQAKRVKK